MKRFTAACSIFLLGISAVMFFHNETAVVRVAAVSEPQIFEAVTEPTTIESEPFFDSFGEDEYFGGWLIADQFPGMEEVWTISLYREERNGNEAVWSAMVLTSNADGSSNDDDNFESIKIKTDSDHLMFSTNKIRGIQYTFEGRFFELGHDFNQGGKGAQRHNAKGR